MPLRQGIRGEMKGVATKAYLKIRATVLDRHKRLYLGCIGRNSYAIYTTSSECM